MNLSGSLSLGCGKCGGGEPGGGGGTICCSLTSLCKSKWIFFFCLENGFCFIFSQMDYGTYLHFERIFLFKEHHRRWFG